MYQVPFREDYDYNYALRMDNKVLSKMSSYISCSLSALTVVFNSLQTFNTDSIYFGVKSSSPKLYV